MVAVPTLIPGLIALLLYKGNIGTALLIALASSYSCYIFYKNYSLIKSVEGYIKRVVISALLFTACLILIEISPEANNAKAGAVFFVTVPCIFIISHMLNNSKPAKRLRELYDNS